MSSSLHSRHVNYFSRWRVLVAEHEPGSEAKRNLSRMKGRPARASKAHRNKRRWFYEVTEEGAKLKAPVGPRWRARLRARRRAWLLAARQGLLAAALEVRGSLTDEDWEVIDGARMR